MSQLTVENLSVLHQEKTMVERLSFSMEPGDSITILGETGSGKSLFAKAIIGDLPSGFSAEGQIFLDGEAIHALGNDRRQSLWGKRISVLPQEPRLALSPLMAIGEQIGEVYRYVLGQEKKQVQQSTESDFSAMNLNQDQHKFPVEISGGMAQRCAFISAKAAGGSLLIADEPTKGLDQHSKQQVIEQLLSHKQQQGTLITITHDLEVARSLGGRVYVLLHGKWRSQGLSYSEWQNDQRDDYSQSLLNTLKRTVSPKKKLGETLLKANQLGLTLSGKPLFNDLSFHLRQGEVLGLSGPSGCGKSSLCDLLLGLKRATQGQIEYCETLNLGQKLKLYQDPPQSFSAAFTLQQQLDDLCRLHKLERSKISEYCQRLKIRRDILTRYPYQVSGGELQRVAILRVLLLKPKLLIADEPTTRLDPHIAQETMELLINTAQEIGCAMVLVSHNRDELSGYCHQIIEF